MLSVFVAEGGDLTFIFLISSKQMYIFLFMSLIIR